MDYYTFTDEELEYISETLRLIVSDLNEIRNISPLKEMTVDFSVKGDVHSWKFVLQPDHIYFTNNSYTFNLEKVNVKKKGFSERKEIEVFDKVKNYATKGQNMALRFLSQYDEIRANLINQIKSSSKDKEKLLESLHRLRAKYSQEVYVDFGIPTTQNVQKLELEEVNGKKIGTIDFGSKIVKVITEGDIILTKLERAKQKVK